MKNKSLKERCLMCDAGQCTPPFAFRFKKSSDGVVKNSISNGITNIASFGTDWAFDRFISLFDIDLTFLGEREDAINGLVKIYKTDKLFYTILFWNLSEIPEGATPIKVYSNGSIVDGFFVIEENDVFVFRPNPNASSVFHPLPIQEHIEHHKKYGYF